MTIAKEPKFDKSSESVKTRELSRNVLARYGSLPQIAVFSMASEFRNQITRNSSIVVETDRGEELAVVLDVLQALVVDSSKPVTGRVIRIAESTDHTTYTQLQSESQTAFNQWLLRLDEWGIQAELIDVEITLDHQTILYVVNDQNAATTRLALLAATNGHGVIHVQPLSAEGVVSQPPAGSGGCGSGGGGCGSGGCGSKE